MRELNARAATPALDASFGMSNGMSSPQTYLPLSHRNTNARHPSCSHDLPFLVTFHLRSFTGLGAEREAPFFTRKGSLSQPLLAQESKKMMIWCFNMFYVNRFANQNPKQRDCSMLERWASDPYWPGIGPRLIAFGMEKCV